MKSYVKQTPFITGFIQGSGMIVVDVNCQGILVAPHQKVFAHEFPITAKQYIAGCVDDSIVPGTVMYYKERGYDIALIVTCSTLVGSNKDHDEKIKNYTKLAIKELESTTTSENMLCSFINWKKHSIFLDAIATEGKTLDWYIYGCKMH